MNDNLGNANSNEYCTTVLFLLNNDLQSRMYAISTEQGQGFASSGEWYVLLEMISNIRLVFSWVFTDFTVREINNKTKQNAKK